MNELPECFGARKERKKRFVQPAGKKVKSFFRVVSGHKSRDFHYVQIIVRLCLLPLKLTVALSLLLHQGLAFGFQKQGREETERHINVLDVLLLL